jgi:hypothetical protein
MIIKGQTSYKYHIKKALGKMQGINKWQYDFILEIFGLFLSVKGRLNFLQLSRYSNHNEQRYRNQFSKPFDFLSFNKELVLEHGGKHLTIAFDPSYVSKSGKATSGVGYYWSGVAGKTKWGLEISGIAAIDIDNHTAFHLEAIQTPNNLKNESLLEHYANTIIQRKKELLCISKYVVADAYFSKHGFISTLSSNGFETVSRLRNDADLKYLYKDEQKKGKGRPKKYDGKINYNDLKESYFTKVERNSKRKIYHAIVFSKSLKRKINLVIVFTNKKGKWNHKLYFCTDLEIDSATVLRYYQTRFQIEFTFRDAKQHTGLNHCQARSENKLYFHFNTALTTINLAKITHWIPIQKELRGPFSMVNIKTMYHNELLLNRFFSVFGIRRNLTKNKEKFKELLYYGARAA